MKAGKGGLTFSTAPRQISRAIPISKIIKNVKIIAGNISGVMPIEPDKVVDLKRKTSRP